MIEFVHSEEKVIGIDEPITLENNTGASFDVGVGVGIIFRKSGLYRVSVDGKYTSVEIEPEWKKGRWINAYPDVEPNPIFMYGICSVCGYEQAISDKLNFCPNCGADMRGGEGE